MNCSIAECGRKTIARGWCAMHYLRWKRHGNPCAAVQRRAKDSAPIEWIKANATFSDDACLLWPFARFKNGYANIEGQSACRVMCEEAHGPPPKASHQTAHSCGKGMDGCINPKHLRWATQSENEADKKLHGTDNYHFKKRTS